MEATVKENKNLSAAASHAPKQGWRGMPDNIGFDEENVRAALLSLGEELYAVRANGLVGIAREGEITRRQDSAADLLAVLPPLEIENLGDPDFNHCYGTRYAYYGGAMASGIASAAMVIALGKAGFMGSFGAAGLPPARLEAAIQQVQADLPAGPYAFNLIHSPNEEALERRAVELYLHYAIHAVEASAFLDLTPHIVYYRAAGLAQGPDGRVEIKNKIIAKISRREVAIKFM